MTKQATTSESCVFDLCRFEMLRRELGDYFDFEKVCQVLGFNALQITRSLDGDRLEQLSYEKDLSPELKQVIEERLEALFLEQVDETYHLESLVEYYKKYCSIPEKKQQCRKVLARIEVLARRGGNHATALQTAKREYKLLKEAFADNNARRIRSIVKSSYNSWHACALLAIEEAKEEKDIKMNDLPDVKAIKVKAQRRIREFQKQELDRTEALSELRSLCMKSTFRGSQKRRIEVKWKKKALEQIKKARTISRLDEIWYDLPSEFRDIAKEKLVKMVGNKFARLKTLSEARWLLNIVKIKLRDDKELVEKIKIKIKQLALLEAKKAEHELEFRRVLNHSQKGGKTWEIVIRRWYNKIS